MKLTITLILSLLLLLLSSFDVDSIEYKKEYSFSSYKVITGFIDESSTMLIYKEGKKVFEQKGGDGYYMKVDTIHINDDGIIDFVYSYNLETYYGIGFLISHNGAKTYRNILTDTEYWDPRDYEQDSSKLNGIKKIADFVVADANGDGKTDIIANIGFDGRQYINIVGWTDTIYNYQIK